MPPIPEGERSSRASSVAGVVLHPPSEKESRVLSGLTAELKKAGGSWGVGAGRIKGTVHGDVEVLLGTEDAAWVWVWKTRRQYLN